MDAKIAAMLAGGVRKDQLSFCFWLAVGVGWEHLTWKGEMQARYGTPLWDAGFANWVRALRDHLFAKGFTYADFVLSTVDEPSGDPDDPKSSTHLALAGSIRPVTRAPPALW